MPDLPLDEVYNPDKPIETCENGHQYPAMAGVCPVCEALDENSPDPEGLPEGIRKQITTGRLIQSDRAGNRVEPSGEAANPSE